MCLSFSYVCLMTYVVSSFVLKSKWSKSEKPFYKLDIPTVVEYLQITCLQTFPGLVAP